MGRKRQQYVQGIYLNPAGRLIMSRSHNRTEAQVYFMLRSDSEEVRDIPKVPTV